MGLILWLRLGLGLRITYTSDGFVFRRVDGFKDLPVKAGDVVFVDTLPITHTNDAVELIRRGVEIRYLRRLTLIKKKREELKLPNTARGDIKMFPSFFTLTKISAF